MSTAIAQLHAILGANIKGFTDGLAKGQSRLNKFASRMGGLSKQIQRAGMVTGAALTGVATAAIKLASDAEEAASKFEIVFGGTATDVGTRLDEFAQQAGRSRYALRSMAGDLAALIGPMGIGEAKTAEMSTALTKLAVDLASFNNIAESDALTALRSGLVGEAEPLRRLGIQLSAAKIEAEAFASGLVTQKDEVNAAIKAQAAFNLIMRYSVQAQGDAIRTADGFANQMKKMGSQLRDLATDLGKVLLPYVTTFIRKLNDGIPKLAQWVKSYAGLAAKVALWAAALGAATIALTKFIQLLVYLRKALLYATKAQTLLLALSGPQGWAVLAGGVAVATAALALLDEEISRVSGNMKVMFAGLGQTGFKRITAQIAAARREVERLEALRESRKGFFKFQGTVHSDLRNAQQRLQDLEFALAEAKHEPFAQISKRSIEALNLANEAEQKLRSLGKPHKDNLVQINQQIALYEQLVEGIKGALQAEEDRLAEYKRQNPDVRGAAPPGFDINYLRVMKRDLELNEEKLGILARQRSVLEAQAKAAEEAKKRREADLANAQKMVEAMEREAKFYGVSDRDSAFAGLLELNPTIEMMDRAFNALAKLDQLDVNKILGDLATELDRVGMSQAEQRIAEITDELKKLGATQAEIDKATGLIQHIEAQSVIDSITTPMERYQKQISKLDDLVMAGALSWEQYDRAVAAAREQLDGVDQSPELLRTGSAEAQRAIFQAQNASVNKTTDTAKQHLKETQKGNDWLEDIADSASKFVDGFVEVNF
jgi:cob(I)alamin adenosyltransferase